MQREIPLATSTSEKDIAGQEELINVYPRASSGGKYPFTLTNTPGLALFCELPTLPVMGMHVMGGRAFAITKTKLYEVLKNGTYKEIGDVDIKGIVSSDDNGRHIVFVDGYKGFYFDELTYEVKQLESEGFYSSNKVSFQDGYFIFTRTGTGQFFISDLLDVTFDPLDFASAEGQPDNLVGAISDHREVFMFGEDTIEVWYNSGSSDFPFERNQGAFVEKGCAAHASIAKMNNTIYFVGSDLMVYQMSGYTPVRISNHGVEKTLKGVDVSNAFAYTYQDEGHLFYVLTIPESNITWCYDASTAAWHIRKSYQFGRHYANCLIYFDSKNLVGDFQNGKIYQMAENFYTDDGQPIVREFILPTLNNGREFLTVDSFELDMSSGVGLISGQGNDPQARVEFSKDGGVTWSNTKFARIGKIGEYLTRVKWNRFGAARQFVFKVQISDPIPIDIGGAWVDLR
jgi:hypothetical protein